jgi:hypothetical protein
MSDINDASKLHSQAADDHEATAKCHRDAAACHDNNQLDEAKTCAKNAMDCCNGAQEKSTTACDCSCN